MRSHLEFRTRFGVVGSPSSRWRTTGSPMLAGRRSLAGVPVSFLCLLVGCTLGGPALAQSKVPMFSHGPSIQAFKIHRQRNVDGVLTDWRVDILASGAGYSFTFHPLCPCDTSWFAIGLPLYASYTSANDGVPGRFNVSPALSLGTLNNIFSLAAGYAFFEIRDDSHDYGLLIGETDRSLFFWTINLGFNLGSGQQEPATAGPQPPSEPPAGFLPL
jgi:hypothetical protein